MKSKKGKKSGKAYIPENDEDLDPVLGENDEETKKVDGKKKVLKPFSSSSKSGHVDYEQEEEEADDADDYSSRLVDFSGMMKKNKKKKGKERTATGFSALLDQEDGEEEAEKEEIVSSEVLEGETEEGNAPEEDIDFSSLKKKKSKSKKEKDQDKAKYRSITDQQQDDGSNPEVINDLDDADNADSIDFSGLFKKGV